MRNVREPLTSSEILDLDRALIGVFQAIREFRVRNPVAGCIKYPSLPSVFSESIAIAATSTFFGPTWSGRHGGRAADLLIENADTGQVMRVEVKATGQHAFQELKEKDIRADALVWIRFGRRFEVGTGPIEVVVLDAPGRHIKSPCRLDVRRFDAIPGVRKNQRILRFENVEAMLTPTGHSTPSGTDH